jgi:GrpB-like predicted nucleotidyltransferase (UPF0157 family)
MDRCLRFRDGLRADSKVAAEYAALKRALAARFREDREGYTKAKSRFITDAVRLWPSGGGFERKDV